MVKKLGKSNACVLFGSSGMMEPLEKVHIEKGTKIFAFGFGMSQQFFVVYDNEMNCVEICTDDPDKVDKFDLEAYFSPRQHLSEETRPISKQFGIGFYYDESDEIISDEIIEKSLKRAENLERLKDEEEKRKEEESRNLTASLKEKYGKILQQCGQFDHKTCGKNIRTELKAIFPTVKFSVKYSSFSGGNSYDISWTNGPTEEEVRNIVGKYQDKHPDPYSMGDYWDYSPSEFNKLFGGVSYVLTHRDECEETKEIDSVDLKIIEYSEKSIAVIGDTKKVKDILKKLGGKFNPRLSCGSGWIFPKKKESVLREFIV